jgi:hypothetical protein
VELDSEALLATRGRGDRDVDGAFDGIEELPKHRGGDVAEDGAFAISENGGHEAPMEAQASVAHGVDAVMDAVELASIDAIANRPRAQTRVFELPPRSHTMLSRGDSCHCDIGRVAFLTHVGA